MGQGSDGFRRNMNMRFGVENVRSLYWAGFLMAVSRELSKYNLDFCGHADQLGIGGR
jgi:hypothetical protein